MIFFPLHPHFHYLSLLVQLVPHSCCASSILYHIHYNQGPRSTFLFDFDSGQWPCDGPLVGHCSVYVFSVMATSWGPVGVCVGCTFEAPMSVQWKANIVGIPKIPLCVDVFDGGLVIFMRWHVCWLTTGGLCEALSLGKAVCCSASTSVSYSIRVQLGWGLGFGWGVK